MHHEVNLLKQDGRMQYTTHHLPEIKGCLDFLIFSTPSEGVGISAKSLTPLEGVELLRKGAADEGFSGWSVGWMCMVAVWHTGSISGDSVPLRKEAENSASYSLLWKESEFPAFFYSFGRSGSVESIGRSDGRGEWAVRLGISRGGGKVPKAR